MATTENGNMADTATTASDVPAHLDVNSTVSVQQVKHRPTFSEDQVAALEAIFEKKPYLSSAERTQLANSINLSAQQVRVWFQNRRQKAKVHPHRQVDKSTGTRVGLYELVTHTLIVCIADGINYIHTHTQSHENR